MTKMRTKSVQPDEKQSSKVHDLEQELGMRIVALAPESRLATLSGEQLRQLQSREEELGVVLLAFEAR